MSRMLPTISMKRWLLLVVATVFLLGASAQAQSAKKRAYPKLTDNLISLHEQYSAHRATRSAESFSSTDATVRTAGDYVVIDAVAAGNTEVLQSDLTALGMIGARKAGRTVSGRLPVSALPAVTNLGSLNFARPKHEIEAGFTILAKEIERAYAGNYASLASASTNLRMIS